MRSIIGDKNITRYIFFFSYDKYSCNCNFAKKEEKREKRGRILSNDSIFSPFILSLEKI